jgi:hypothetical protein
LHESEIAQTSETKPQKAESIFSPPTKSCTFWLSQAQHVNVFAKMLPRSDKKIFITAQKLYDICNAKIKTILIGRPQFFTRFQQLCL